MKAIKYVLEIYSPENPQEILRSFEATDPFILISCGSILNPSQWTDRYEGQLLRVSQVEHGISEGEGITQTLMVHTEVDDGRGDRKWHGMVSDLTRKLRTAGDKGMVLANEMLERYEPMIREVRPGAPPGGSHPRPLHQPASHARRQ